ncbi:MAG: DotD/TraH family lipoprotein [Bdellovibrionales bacterium]
MNHYLSAFCLCTLSIALIGCETANNNFSNSTPQLVAEPDTVSSMLADAATRASNALETLAAVEHGRGPAIASAPIGDAPANLRRAITVNWVGPAEQITETLAQRASYNFVTVGVKPAVPVIVSIDAENKPVIEVLRDVGLQLGLRGDVRVDANNEVVEIHYSPNTGAR